jgi:hypothetical protein
MTTWNSSAKQKLNRAYIALDLYPFDEGELLHRFGEISTAVQKNYHHDYIYSSLTSLGDEAVRGLEAINQWNPDEMLELLVSKQHDYGHGNILAFGIVGVGIRACDKVARYFNLKDRPDKAHNEPFIDCLKDMVGYAIIGQMLRDETFMLELEDK